MQGSDPYLVLTWNGEIPLLLCLLFVTSHLLTARHTVITLPVRSLRTPRWPSQGCVLHCFPSPGLMLILTYGPITCPSLSPFPRRCHILRAGSALVPLAALLLARVWTSPGWSTGTQKDETKAVATVSEDNSAHSPSAPYRGKRFSPGSCQLSWERRKSSFQAIPTLASGSHSFSASRDHGRKGRLPKKG